MTEKEIMQALRCDARHKTPENVGCKKCPYWETKGLEEWQKLHGWTSCKVYQIISDAADAIERLSAENAALREEKTWRRAMQEPPEEHEDVALYVAGKLFKACRAAGDAWFLKVSDDTFAMLLLPGSAGQKAHWMPLPEVPEEGEA